MPWPGDTYSSVEELEDVGALVYHRHSDTEIGDSYARIQKFDTFPVVDTKVLQLQDMESKFWLYYNAPKKMWVAHKPFHWGRGQDQRDADDYTNAVWELSQGEPAK